MHLHVNEGSWYAAIKAPNNLQVRHSHTEVATKKLDFIDLQEMMKQLLVISALLMIGTRVLAQQQQIEEENPTSKLLPRRYNCKRKLCDHTIMLFVHESI